MQINQIASMIEWLDEERRRDKALIATLEERVAQQSNSVDTMQRRVNTVESDQALIKQEALPAKKEHDIIDHVRQDMEQMIENAEARRLTAEREAERRLELQRENIQRAVAELSEKADRLEKQLANISDLQTEGDRLTNAMRLLNQEVDDLTKKLESPDRRLSFLEEQRRTDTRRLAEIESELPEYKKSVDGIQPKLALLEDLAVRNERRIQDFNNLDRERRDQIQQFIDQQQLMVQQRDQQLAELTKRFGVHDEELRKNIERFEVWAQAYREMKRIVDDFNRIGDRLERRINEASEMQRLSEERFREEWNDWRDEDQKRWKQLTLSSDEVWRNHDREFDAFIKRVNTVEQSIPGLHSNIERLWLLERARAELYRERYQAMLHEFDRSESASAVNSNSRVNTDRIGNA
jgi:chromosome segregation ATPase